MTPRFIYCNDCGADVLRLREYHYKVKSELWLTVANSSEFLCIKCLESRLGRELSPNDFTNESVNQRHFGRKSATLVNRLSKEVYKQKQLKKLERRTE